MKKGIPLLGKKKEMEKAPTAEKQSGKHLKPHKLTKKKIILLVILAACIVGVVFAVKHHGKNQGNSEVLTDFVSRGAISTTVEGSGTTLPKNSASLTLPVAGKVQEVNVAEGQTVKKGDPLFRVHSDATQEAVTNAQKDVDQAQKELQKLQNALKDLTVAAPYAGKLIDVQDIRAGQSINAGDKIAHIVDDSKMRLVQYYSYAYDGQIRVGQAATISVPSTMAQVSGKVESVTKVRRVSANGSLLFRVDLVMNNPGALTGDMAASAVMTSASGEAIYPYEAGKLEYYRSGDLTAKATGTVQQINTMEYATVSAGQTLLTVRAKDSQDAIENQQAQLRTLTETLNQAKAEQAKLQATAPIDGTVMSVGITAGEDAAAGTIAVSIADTSVMLVNAKIDERNIAYIQTGMAVDLDQWGVAATGTVTSVSLTGTTENGVTTFPAVITVDNSEGTLTSGGSINYSFMASQNDDCLLLPIQCVKNAETEDGGVSVVFLKADHKPKNAVELLSGGEDVPKGFYPVPVKTGISDNTSVEIVSGVSEGDEVFTQMMDTNSDDAMAG